jgi:hypothetical protein
VAGTRKKAARKGKKTGARKKTPARKGAARSTSRGSEDGPAAD